ncbi:MAG: DUF1778 domain-containing protein [Desulfobacteraceae bacterium]|nr:DUF1778 domain-containing protein [Desulfobacteraceae bacterium]MBC2757509.1 DUF1778 domain-containing protein [Desulfobacteraceae bacterium]
MKAPTQANKERINIRLESSVKTLLERAAGLEGKTVSKFVLHSALEQAKKTVHEHEAMALNAQNSKTFFNALAATVSFNSKLTDALEEHSQRVVSK